MHRTSFTRWVIGVPVVVCCFAISLRATYAWSPFSRPAAETRPVANAEANGVRNTDTPALTRRGPLFHGQELRWPAMPFARHKPAAKAAQSGSLAPNRTTPYGASQTASRFGSQSVGGTSGPMSHSQQRMSHNPTAFRPYGKPAPVERGPQRAEPVVRATYDPAQVPMESPPSGNAVQRAIGGVARSGRPMQPSATNPEPAAASRAESNAAPVATAMVPESPADRLLSQAHSASSAAQTEADFSRIIDTCRRAAASQPSPDTGRYAGELASWAFNRRGQIKAEAGRDKEALSDFDNAIRSDSHRWRAIHNRGVLLAQSGEFERAFDDFSRTIQLNAKFAKAYSNRAALLMVAGDLAAAQNDYSLAIERDPALAVAHRGLGRACHLLGRVDEALGHYDDAVRLMPDDAYAAACRADLLTDLGRYGEAVAEYERTIELDPKSGHAYSSSAWLLATCPDASVRNAELAIERAKIAIELTAQKDAVSFDTLAAAQANAGDFSAAMHTVRQAVQLAPAEERELYEERLVLYQHAKPYRIAPVGRVMQASYEN
ncbi:MAG: tetratricopeptide repeat protein [Pirellulales bacterium]